MTNNPSRQKNRQLNRKMPCCFVGVFFFFFFLYFYFYLFSSLLLFLYIPCCCWFLLFCVRIAFLVACFVMLVRGEIFPGSFFFIFRGGLISSQGRNKQNLRKRLIFLKKKEYYYNNLLKLLRTIVILFHAGIVWFFLFFFSLSSQYTHRAEKSSVTWQIKIDGGGE